MGTVVRDWRLTGVARARSQRASRASLSTAPVVGFEVHHPPPDVTSGPRTIGRIAMVLLPLLLVVLWAWWVGAERRAIRALPPEQRAAVFEEALRGFAPLCAPPRAGLERHCRRQAAFLMNFPECDEHCLSLTRPILQWRS